MAAVSEGEPTYEFKQKLVTGRLKGPRQHLLEGVRPVFKIVRADAYVIHCCDLQRASMELMATELEQAVAWAIDMCLTSSLAQRT